MEANTHTQLLKGEKSCVSEVTEHQTVINVSRSIGHTGDWIGCGYINKSGTKNDVSNYRFPFFSLVYVVQGKGTYLDEHHQATPLTNGSLFQRQPGVLHSTLIDPEHQWNEYYIDFNSSLYEKITALGLIDDNTTVYQVPPDKTITVEFEKLIYLLDGSPDHSLPDVSLKFLFFVRDLINQSNLRQTGPDKDYMIQKSCIDFNRSLSKRIDIRDYCKQNGWGYESFRKKFKKSIGVSPVQYMVRRRLDESCRLLRSTNMKISEISLILGYASQYEFSNQFKKQFGVFPKHFKHGIGSKPV